MARVFIPPLSSARRTLAVPDSFRRVRSRASTVIVSSVTLILILISYIWLHISIVSVSIQDPHACSHIPASLIRIAFSTLLWVLTQRRSSSPSFPPSTHLSLFPLDISAGYPAQRCNKRRRLDNKKKTKANYINSIARVIGYLQQLTLGNREPRFLYLYTTSSIPGSHCAIQAFFFVLASSMSGAIRAAGVYYL